MATASELISLRNRIAAIIAHHAPTTARVTEGMLKGGTSPSGALSYLSADEFTTCITSGFLTKYVKSVNANGNTLNVTPPQGGDSPD